MALMTFYRQKTCHNNDFKLQKYCPDVEVQSKYVAHLNESIDS